MQYKYIVVGGSPFRGYTNTLSFTSLDVVGKGNTVDEITDIVREKYDECGGLMLVIDTETGSVADI